MTGIGALVLILGALVVTSIAMYIVEVPKLSYWMATWAAAIAGGFVASVAIERLGPASALGPAYEGLLLVPALLGASVLAAAGAWLAVPDRVTSRDQGAPQLQEEGYREA